jgi:hypothetical protein
VPTTAILGRILEEKHAKNAWIIYYYSHRMGNGPANTKSDRSDESLEIAAV